MPELPEVETVRAGLAAHINDAVIGEVEVLRTRSIRQHVFGEQDFRQRLRGKKIANVSRRGKFLWMPLQDVETSIDFKADEALVVHLGMSGQVLLVEPASDPEKQLRVRLELIGAPFEIRFVDQRMFGGLHIDQLITVDHEPRVPQSVAHIARDALDPLLDVDAVVASIRRRTAGIKSLLLNQEIMSGIGNIYADEALWRSKLHYATPGLRLGAARLRQLVAHSQEIMRAATEAGGTSFDDLYVNVNGESGWFDVTLAAYGQEGLPCPRCGRPIVREAWSNRSSHRCPRCQPRPRV
jgi:formamidopyrimidine-DNA glycosylase